MSSIQIVTERHDIRRAYEWLSKSILIANDIETQPDLGLITVNGFSGVHPSGEIRTYVTPWLKGKTIAGGAQPELAYMIDGTRELNASGIRFTYHNGSYDLYYLTKYGLPVSNYAYDSMTMFWSLYPELPKTLDFVSSILLDDYQYWKGDRKTYDATTYWIYNGKDNDRTIRNTLRLMDILSANPRALENFKQAHLRVMSCLGMSLRGINLDLEKRADYGVELEQESKDLEEKLRYLVANPNFNFRSPQQKKELLYGMLGIRMRNAKGKFVKKLSDASTGAVNLRAMRSEHPIFRVICQAMLDVTAPAKQISNVIHMNYNHKNSRVHTEYKATGTITGRLSSSEPPDKTGSNLQNVRAKYRDIFTADKGLFCIDIDYSAVDDVFVTHESSDPNKLKLFQSGLDTHCANAAMFFSNWTYDEVLAGKRSHDIRVVDPITGIRQITKKLSHGCNYLMAALTLLLSAGREAIVAAAKEEGYKDAGYWKQDQLIEFCGHMESKYRTHYERFKRSGAGSWYKDLQKEVASTGGFTTMFNYFERFIGNPDDDRTLRGVAASAGQANAAGLVNAVLAELDLGYISPTFRDHPNPAYGTKPLRISRESHGISTRLQTHDSFTFVVDPKHPKWEEGVQNIFDVMSRPVYYRNKLTGEYGSFVVPIESSVGPRWGKTMFDLKENTIDAIHEIGIPELIYPGNNYGGAKQPLLLK